MEYYLKLADFFMSYYSLLLVRCACISFIMMALIMLLRLFLKNNVFLKGMLWGFMLIVPFLGKLKIFYESRTVLKGTWWIMVLCSKFSICRLYFAGILISLIVIGIQRIRISTFVKKLEKHEVCKTNVYICKLCVTPFTTGVIHPKIVIPGKMFDEYEEDDLETVILHEMQHIRLGHLIFYLIWDIWHALLWINPLFFVCVKYFKEDCEDICDRVTIHAGDNTGYNYGNLLLKSIRLFQNEDKLRGMRAPFNFSGEKNFRQIKKRIKKVAGYKEYSRRKAFFIVGLETVIIAGLFLVIKSSSYARYTDFNDIAVYDFSAKKVIIEDSEDLREAVSFDKDYLYLDEGKFAKLLKDRNIDDKLVVVVYGGFYKVPGYGGGCGCEIIETATLGTEKRKIESTEAKGLDIRIFKYM